MRSNDYWLTLQQSFALLRRLVPVSALPLGHWEVVSSSVILDNSADDSIIHDVS